MKQEDVGIIIIGGIALGAMAGAAFWPPAFCIGFVALITLALISVLVVSGRNSDDGD